MHAEGASLDHSSCRPRQGSLVVACAGPHAQGSAGCSVCSVQDNHATMGDGEHGARQQLPAGRNGDGLMRREIFHGRLCSQSFSVQEACPCTDSAHVCNSLGTAAGRRQPEDRGGTAGRASVSPRRCLRQGGCCSHLAVGLALVMLLHQYGSARGDRAGDSLFLDGGQEPFNSTDPPSPGFVYLTPRKSSRGLPPWVSFSSPFICAH
jgi:hypothetical protein